MTDPHTIQSIDAAGRPQECDLIMKGGVTSGLVYPGAIATLSETFRLRNIGGTSAGAIGAVAAAAMEYGRGRAGTPRPGNAWPGCTKNWPSAPIGALPGLMPCSAAIRAPRRCLMR